MDSESLPHGNNATAVSSPKSTSLSAVATTGEVTSTSAFFLVIVVIYVVLTILYLLQKPISRTISCCFGRRRRRKAELLPSQSHNNYQHQNQSYLRWAMSCCSQMISICRIFVFNCTNGLYDDAVLTIHHVPIDEGTYQSWTVPQVAQWTYSQLQKQMNENRAIASSSPLHSFSEFRASTTSVPDDRDQYGINAREDAYHQKRAIQSAIAVLKRQRIDGKSLEHLTLDHLLNFGIAFGIAIHLMACLDELIPNKRFASDIEKGGGGEFPAWYEDGNSNGLATKNNNDTSSVGEQQLEMAKRAQDVMKDRFGMTLPELRDQNASNGVDNNLQSDQKQPYPSGELAQFGSVSNNQQPYHVEDKGNSNVGADFHEQETQSPMKMGKNAIDNILDSMPPHVRAVAERRPDLVTKLLSEREQQMQIPQSQRHQDMAGSLQTVSEEGIDYHSEEDINIDQESVSLLRRRTNR